MRSKFILFAKVCVLVALLMVPNSMTELDAITWNNCKLGGAVPKCDAVEAACFEGEFQFAVPGTTNCAGQFWCATKYYVFCYDNDELDPYYNTAYCYRFNLPGECGRLN